MSTYEKREWVGLRTEWESSSHSAVCRTLSASVSHKVNSLPSPLDEDKVDQSQLFSMVDNAASKIA